MSTSTVPAVGQSSISILTEPAAGQARSNHERAEGVAREHHGVDDAEESRSEAQLADQHSQGQLRASKGLTTACVKGN